MYMILSNISIHSRVGKFVTRCDSNVVFLILHALSVFYELPFRVKNKCLFFFKGFRNIFTAISIIYNIPLRLFTTRHLPHLSNLLLRSSSNCFFQRVASNFQIDSKTCLKKKKKLYLYVIKKSISQLSFELFFNNCYSSKVTKQYRYLYYIRSMVKYRIKLKTELSN